MRGAAALREHPRFRFATPEVRRDGETLVVFVGRSTWAPWVAHEPSVMPSTPGGVPYFAPSLFVTTVLAALALRMSVTRLGAGLLSGRAAVGRRRRDDRVQIRFDPAGGARHRVEGRGQVRRRLQRLELAELALPAARQIVERGAELGVRLLRGLLDGRPDRLRALLQLVGHRLITRLEIRGLVRGRRRRAASATSKHHERDQHSRARLRRKLHHLLLVAHPARFPRRAAVYRATSTALVLAYVSTLSLRLPPKKRSPGYTARAQPRPSGAAAVRDVVKGVGAVSWPRRRARSRRSS